MFKHIKDFLKEVGKRFLIGIQNSLYISSMVCIIIAILVITIFLSSLIIGYIHITLFEKGYVSMHSVCGTGVDYIQQLSCIGAFDIVLGILCIPGIIIISTFLYIIFIYFRSIWKQTHEK